MDANATAPETLAPATAFAVVAKATAPETLAPVMFDIFPPSPLKIPETGPTKFVATMLPVNEVVVVFDVIV